MTEPVKRGRGRPKKQPVSESNTADFVLTELDEAPVETSKVADVLKAMSNKEVVVQASAIEEPLSNTLVDDVKPIESDTKDGITVEELFRRMRAN